MKADERFGVVELLTRKLTEQDFYFCGRATAEAALSGFEAGQQLVEGWRHVDSGGSVYRIRILLLLLHIETNGLERRVLQRLRRNPITSLCDWLREASSRVDRQGARSARPDDRS